MIKTGDAWLKPVDSEDADWVRAGSAVLGVSESMEKLGQTANKVSEAIETTFTVYFSKRTSRNRRLMRLLWGGKPPAPVKRKQLIHNGRKPRK